MVILRFVEMLARATGVIGALIAVFSTTSDTRKGTEKYFFPSLSCPVCCAKTAITGINVACAG